MATIQKKRWAIGAIIIALLVTALLFPLPVRQSDEERIVVFSAQRLRSQDRVLVDWQFIPFYDAELIAGRSRQWNYLNDTELECSALEQMGFNPILRSEFKNLNLSNWYGRNVLVEITTRNLSDEAGSPRLRFNVYHGIMGAQGYRVRIYRCLLGLFARYECEWVS
jgi:hypothetical protein